MRNRYDMQLHLLDTQLTHMGELCETAIAKVTQALKEGNTEQAKIVIKEDEEIDQIEKDIERLCLKLLLQQQPVARDLRRISAALKMITDMERIGDQASDIAELSLQLGDVSDIDEISLIQKMANETMMMVVRGTEAYVTKDLDVAHNVIDNDDVVDDLFDQIKMALVKRIQDNHVKSFEAADLLMVEPDTCWIKVAGQDPVEYIHKYGSRCEVIHLKDFVKEGNPQNLYKLIGIETEKKEEDTGFFEFRPVGFGQMLWEPILNASLEAGAKWVVVEQDEHYDLPPMECARRSREYLKILGW